MITGASREGNPHRDRARGELARRVDRGDLRGTRSARALAARARRVPDQGRRPARRDARARAGAVSSCPCRGRHARCRQHNAKIRQPPPVSRTNTSRFDGDHHPNVLSPLRGSRHRTNLHPNAWNCARAGAERSCGDISVSLHPGASHDTRQHGRNVTGTDRDSSSTTSRTPARSPCGDPRGSPAMPCARGSRRRRRRTRPCAS